MNSVLDDGPAKKGGIEAGDIILSIDGEEVTIVYPEQIPPLLKDLSEKEIGSTVNMTVLRENETVEVAVVTEKRQRDRGEEAVFRAWGISAKAITERMARNRRLDGTEGVLVSGVRSGSTAATAEPEINYGDVIRKIDDKPIKTLADFVDCYEEITDREELPEYLLVEFDRGGKNQITLLKPKPEKDEDPPREVRKAWIGVATQPVIEKLAKYLGHDKPGFRITRVYPQTLAAQSDLRTGDLILKLNDDRLIPKGNQDSGMFQRKVRRLSIDDEAKLTVLREGDEMEIALTLEKTRLEPGEARRDHNRDFEMTVRELTFFDRDERRWDKDVRGVLVESVEDAGWAGLGGLSSGDLIQRIGNKKIHGLKSYRKTMDEITKQQPERVVFVVLRGVRTQFQYVEPEWKPVVEDETDKQTEE